MTLLRALVSGLGEVRSWGCTSIKLLQMMMIVRAPLRGAFFFVFTGFVCKTLKGRAIL